MAQWTSVNISEPFFFGFFFMFESVPFQGESLSMFLAFALLGHGTAGSFHDHGSTDHGHLGAESWNGVCTYVHRYTHVCIITCCIYNIYIYMYTYRCIYSMYIYLYIYIIYICVVYIYIYLSTSIPAKNDDPYTWRPWTWHVVLLGNMIHQDNHG